MDDAVKDQSGRTTSRRAILAGALGGIGAWAAGAIGRATPAQAVDGEVVHLGDNLIGTQTTVFNVSNAGFSALWGNSTATSESGVGVRGDTASNHGLSAGVLGIAAQGIGVRGTGLTGVRGDTTSGIALRGVAGSAGGYGIRTSGRVRFDKVCGVASLAAGTTSKVISPGTDVTADSFVLLTPGADIGTRRLWFTKSTTSNTITIRMSSSRSSATSISWLLLR